MKQCLLIIISSQRDAFITVAVCASDRFYDYYKQFSACFWKKD